MSFDPKNPRQVLRRTGFPLSLMCYIVFFNSIGWTTGSRHCFVLLLFFFNQIKGKKIVWQVKFIKKCQTTDLLVELPIENQIQELINAAGSEGIIMSNVSALISWAAMFYLK